MGVRCLEIDCHDGSTFPIVKHGYTATSPVTFEAVIEHIQKWRQKVSLKHSPIILSL